MSIDLRIDYGHVPDAAEVAELSRQAYIFYDMPTTQQERDFSPGLIGFAAEFLVPDITREEALSYQQKFEKREEPTTRILASLAIRGYQARRNTVRAVATAIYTNGQTFSKRTFNTPRYSARHAAPTYGRTKQLQPSH